MVGQAHGSGLPQVHGQARVRIVRQIQPCGDTASPLSGWTSLSTRSGSDLLVPHSPSPAVAQGQADVAGGDDHDAETHNMHEQLNVSLPSEGPAAARIRSQLATLQAIAKSNKCAIGQSTSTSCHVHDRLVLLADLRRGSQRSCTRL